MNIEINSVCIVAIAKDEGEFIEEWLAYHRLLGVDYFFLYDDDPAIPLKNITSMQDQYVKIIPWHKQHFNLSGRNRQTKAYKHAVANYCKEFEWVLFIDIDEFLVLKNVDSLKEFLKQFSDVDSISFNWHVFGHNGYYKNPNGLIIDSLTRRMKSPSIHVKSITRPTKIRDIDSAHFCRLTAHSVRVDANGLRFTDEIYPGKTRIAHINHYQCRSFLNWMQRSRRGCVTIDSETDIMEDNFWRVNSEACMKKFVTTVALDKNEFKDNYMKKYVNKIRGFLNNLKLARD